MSAAKESTLIKNTYDPRKDSAVRNASKKITAKPSLQPEIHKISSFFFFRRMGTEGLELRSFLSTRSQMRSMGTKPFESEWFLEQPSHMRRMGKPGIEPGTSAYLTIFLDLYFNHRIKASPEKGLNPHHSQLNVMSAAL